MIWWVFWQFIYWLSNNHIPSGILSVKWRAVMLADARDRSKARLLDKEIIRGSEFSFSKAKIWPVRPRMLNKDFNHDRGQLCLHQQHRSSGTLKKLNEESIHRLQLNRSYIDGFYWPFTRREKCLNIRRTFELYIHSRSKREITVDGL